MKTTPPPIVVTSAMHHILLSLADGDRHGYAIMQAVAELSGGTLRLGPGTLYSTLKRLLADRLIEETDKRPAPSLDDERRRYYHLTSAGRRVVAQETARLSRLVSFARSRRITA